jgi:DNA phosphorothioation-dependent restriction protein DptG
MPRPSLDELLHAAGFRGGRVGLLALREDVTRLRRSDLRKQSRDVVNQLMLHQVGGLLSRNGTSMTFYEVDEDLLTLLVRLICRNEPVAFESFLSGLADYGLQPQDAPEQERLTHSLERLGLLIRYSDAGEATYVRYNR